MNSIAYISTILCFSFVLFYVTFGAIGTVKDKLRDLFGSTDSTFLVMMSLPILLSGAICCLLLTRQSRKLSPKRKNLPRCLPDTIHRLFHRIRDVHGDRNFDFFAILFVFLPCVSHLTTCIYRHLHGRQLSRDGSLHEIGNGFGIMSILACSFFLVPVARQSSLLNLLHWSPARAVRLHIWSGRIVILAGVIHGVVHMCRWIESWEKLVSMLIPPMSCWVSNRFHGLDDDLSCYDIFRNFTGLIAFIASLVIGISSLNFVRRKYYQLFYILHVSVGPIFFIMVILHYNRSILYLAPSILFYVASSFPVFVENRMRSKCVRQGDKCGKCAGGNKIVSVEHISSQPWKKGGIDSSCASITFEASLQAMNQFQPGHYVKLLVPDLSSFSHPFTINQVPGRKDQLRIIFKATGSFTKRLADRLQDGGPLPCMVIDGYYGSPNRVEEVLEHDMVIMVAGGIGITPYLSLIHEVHTILSSRKRRYRTKKIVLHWVCRDQDLIDYVKLEYLDPLYQRLGNSNCDFDIIVHHTGLATMGPFGIKQPMPSYTDIEMAARDHRTQLTTEDTAKGIKFTPSSFSPGSETHINSNLRTFLVFSIVAGLGLWIVCYVYSNYQSSIVVSSRAVSPVAIVLLGLAVAVTANNSPSFKILGKSYESISDSIREHDGIWWVNNDDDYDDESDITGNSRDIELEDYEQLRHEAATAIENKILSSVIIKESSGRPTMDEILKDIETDDGHLRNVGLFSCGPPALMEQLQHAVEERLLTRIRDSCQEETTGIALYEEAFVM